MTKAKHRVFLAHNACLNSSYDLNVLKVGLAGDGYEVVDRPEDADEVVFSGCSVRSKWVDDAINQIDQIHARVPGAHITVTGCIANVSAQAVRDRTVAQAISFQTQADILRDRTGLEFQAVDRGVSQDTSHDYEGNSNNGLTQLRQRVGPEKAAVVARLQKVDREFGTALAQKYQRETKGFVFYHEVQAAELITVTRSCLYQCTFCSIPKGRGPFTSVPLEDVLFKAKAALARGVHRFILVGDEIGNYGADKPDEKFPDLLRSLVALDPGVRISIRYIEPKPFLRHAALLRELCAAGQIDLLYISLQSGSPRILKAMNRGSTIDAVTSLYATFRMETDVVFYCNWMVGFPGETEEDFQRTVELAKKLNLQISVAIPFSSRPGTPAEKFDEQIDETTKTERVSRLTEVIADIKAAQFEVHLSFLGDVERLSVLDLIREAEMRLYAEPKTEQHPVTFHRQRHTEP